MICIHCGQCCYDFPVTIIKPEFVNLKVESTIDFSDEAFYNKPANTPCPHLRWNYDFSHCSVHDKPWYKETPCFEFTQIEESSSRLCRLGMFVIKMRRKDPMRYNYRIRCENFVKPKSPEKINEEFKKGGT